METRYQAKLARENGETGKNETNKRKAVSESPSMLSLLTPKPSKKLLKMLLDSIDEVIATEAADSKKSTAKEQKKNKIAECVQKPLDTDVYNGRWEPDYWNTVLQNLQQMRSKSDAPVDSMGCHKCGDDDADEKTQRYQKLVALMLSSQTKDQITFETMSKLKQLPLKPEKIVKMDTDALAKLLVPVSFYKNKAKYLQKTSKLLLDKYDGDIPTTADALIKLPGVGPKMAHICMDTAWGKVSGIGVDVHVHRISNRLGWVRKPTQDPEKTRKELESWLPECYWGTVNKLLVGFGQTICTAQNPKCGECLNKNLCPYAKSSQVKITKRPKKEM